MEDMLPNDGSVFNPYQLTPEQEKEEREAQAKAEQSYPIIDDLLADIETRIKDADSASKLGINSSMPTLQAQIIIEGNGRFVALLEGYKTYLESTKEQVRK